MSHQGPQWWQASLAGEPGKSPSAGPRVQGQEMRPDEMRTGQGEPTAPLCPTFLPPPPRGRVAAASRDRDSHPSPARLSSALRPSCTPSLSSPLHTVGLTIGSPALHWVSGPLGGAPILTDTKQLGTTAWVAEERHGRPRRSDWFSAGLRGHTCGLFRGGASVRLSGCWSPCLPPGPL